MKKNILLVEDEKDIAEMMKSLLETMDFNVTLSHDGQKAIELIQNHDKSMFDLFILDRMLPNMNGIEICKFLRMFKATKSHPILMVTAMTTPEQIVEGLDAGADDYITKPFDMKVLMARVKSLIRRVDQLKVAPPQGTNEIFDLHGLIVDTNQCKAFINQNELDLTLSEYKLLVAFMQQPGKVLTRNQLVEFIQDGPVHVTDRTIDTHVFGLRKKLGEHAKFIETIRGVGYRVTPHGN